MKQLFEPTCLGSLKLKNRLIRSGTSQAMSPTSTYNTEKLHQIYTALAKGGVGAIITSFPLVDQSYHTDEDVPENQERVYEKLTDICHAEGCAAIAQLVLVNYRHNMPPDLMTQDDLKAVENMFVTAAHRAKKAGYDGIQLHVAHSLFLSRFISPARNHRTDEYGGNQKNRSRLVTDIIRRIKEECPGLHISMKINNCDGTPKGLSQEQSLATCKYCTEAGIDSIEVSGNGTSASGIIAGVNESYYKDFALLLADTVDIPVILVGGNRSIDSMEKILNSGKIEFMSLSRPLIREPALPDRWLNGDKSPAKCISCNLCYRTPWQECAYNLKEDQ